MRAIMVVGTASHVGKSLVTTALCRLLSRRGWRVAPFKGQNQVLNSYVTATGGEMGYAQAVQAWAAGVPPQIDMNPILLKPQGDQTCKILLKGRSVGRTTLSQYYNTFLDQGWQTIQDSLGRLSQDYDFLVCEGSGSPVEVNLGDRDLANMRIAKHLQAPTVLVADSDRGGTFAHIIGTLELMTPEERKLVKGIIINKFRGQPEILEPGLQWLRDRTGIPILGVIPWLDQAVPADDSLSLLDRTPGYKKQADITIAVVRLPRISNFTDFDPLEAEPNVRVIYLSPKEHLSYPDAVIIPGTKTTIADLLTLQRSGMAAEIQNYVAAGGTVMGICGGFQMMGQFLADPEGIEGHEGRFPGLDLFPLRTVITQQKIARQRTVSSRYPQEGLPVSGYELHQGRAQLILSEGKDQHGTQFEFLFEDRSLGVVDSTQSLWGTYLHGIFDNGPWRRAWLNRLRQQRGLGSLPTGIPNYREQREALLNSLAESVGEHLDLKPLLG
ncbi:MAG: cobyric acid synthase CobQ [Leptolyngbya sp. LCM1.Bin17]|nr:MAG: cobyric acid synthase CobQ [Leptolyngbya sp. LCM1.Bin17]